MPNENTGTPENNQTQQEAAQTQEGSTQGTGGSQAGGSTQGNQEAVNQEGVGGTEKGSSTVPPVYAPNYKFKVMDEEKEFDEFVRASIKDQDNEKKIRELYEKAYGLDHVKPKYEKVKNDYGVLEKNWNSVTSDLQLMGGYLQKKDYNSLLKMLKIPDEDILQHAIEKMSYYELPPEKRQQMDKQAQVNEEYVRLQRQVESLSSQIQGQETQRMQQDFEAAISLPHVQTLEKDFDTRAGQQGAFRNAVVANAVSHYNMTKQDFTPQQAVEHFMKVYGFQSQQASNPQTTQTMQRAPTIPSTKGSGSSAIKQKTQSLESLRKLAANMAE